MVIDVLVEAPMGKLSAAVRSAPDPKILAERTRASAAQIENGGTVTPSFASISSPELDVRLSSCAKEKCYELHFGFAPGIRRPEAVRRPRFADGAREGLVYFLLKKMDGEIAVGVCLRDDDMRILKMDAEFGKYAIYVD
jgi:hypothetical protein